MSWTGGWGKVPNGFWGRNGVLSYELGREGLITLERLDRSVWEGWEDRKYLTGGPGGKHWRRNGFCTFCFGGTTSGERRSE